MEIRLFPSDDTELADAFETALADASRDAGARPGDGALLDAIARRLRLTYPRLTIGTQSDLGRLGDEPRRWYVYRDGHVMADQPDGTGLSSISPGSAAAEEPATGG